ncbi:unnamed protein product [Rhizoctonia solani]|uniref:Uncharacterized protein n=1 Tax=Rhizoctonia solani TaxID=456999 RepID=A0A8H3I3I5_9AGAM|nr:unnamed protein product [Rhizoctonia solani]
MQNTARRVVDIPELLTSVAYCLARRQRRELMLVSHYFFTSVGPTVWGEIPRLDIMLRLIIGAKGSHQRYGRDRQGIHPSYSQTTITLPSNPDLSRYHIYAPWVRELEIFAGRNLEIQNAGPFLALFGGGPLLPNLRRVTTHTGADIGSKEMMKFLNMFIAPSLTEIRTIIHKKGLPSYVHPSGVPAFIKKIKDTCPHIQVLEFYPESAYDCPEGYRPTDRCRDILRSFSNLRFFGSTTYIFEPSIFAIMGNLPHLAVLSVRGFYMEDPVLDAQVSIPETWFPALKVLRLYDTHPRDIKVLWKHPPVVKKLISVLIHTDPTAPPDRSDNVMDGNKWIEEFLTALPSLSPGLKDLTFYVGDEDGTKFQVSQHVRNGLHNLGLKHLDLKLRNTYGADSNDESNDE